MMGAQMMKLVLAVIALIAAVMVAGVYFSFNPVILIFIILGFGVYMVGRIGGPALPDDAPIVTGSGYGIYIRPKDYVADDTSCGGENPKQGDGFR
jgi:hypothetical protein